MDDADTPPLDPPGSGVQDMGCALAASECVESSEGTNSGNEDAVPSKKCAQETFCGVCHGGASLQDEAIIVCDGCKLAVHQGCYGAGKDTQQGGWRCRPCTLLPPGPERDGCRCVICGKTGGALKPTEGGEAWAHLWCVWWDPNAYIAPTDMADMEPVRFTQPSAGPSRPVLPCVCCADAVGTCTIRCFSPGCDAHMHPSCAREADDCHISVAATMGTFFRAAYCPAHAEQGLDPLIIVDRLCQQAATLLEVPEKSVARLVRLLIFSRKMQTIKARVISRTHYPSPQAFVDDTLTTLASMPGDTTAASRLFVELSNAWLRSSDMSNLHVGTAAASAAAQDQLADGNRAERGQKNEAVQGSGGKRIEARRKSREVTSAQTGVRRSSREHKRPRGPWWDDHVKKEIEEEAENVQQQPQQVLNRAKGNDTGKKRCRAATAKSVKLEPVDTLPPAPGSGVLIGKKRSSTPTKARPRTPPPAGPMCKLEPPDENEEAHTEWEEEEEEEEEDDDEVVIVEADKTVDLTDVACDVCGTDESLEDDAILACDGCNVSVHQSCYGISKIPDGDWFCTLCERKRAVASGRARRGQEERWGCHFCGIKGGAMKCTKDSLTWAHVSCVWFDPDARLGNDRRMEPVLLGNPAHARRGLLCSMCHSPRGLCITCKWTGCDRPFHARCARTGGYLSMEPQLGSLLTEAYCHEHRNQRIAATDIARYIRLGLMGTPASGQIISVERRLMQGGDEEDERKYGRPYKSFEEFYNDIKMPLNNLAGRPGKLKLAEDLRVRLKLLKRGLDLSKTMIGGNVAGLKS